MPRKDDKPDPQKQLMIKVKACQRLAKEAAYYEKETAENEAKLQQMKDEGKDSHDIKKFAEVLGESQMMIPDSIARRDRAVEDLREFMALLRKEEAGNAEVMGCPWWGEAGALLGEGVEDKKEGGGDDVAVTAVEGLAEGEAF